MYKIVRKQILNADMCLFEFAARDLAMAAGAGQFVILRIDEYGERFPLTLYDIDKDKGTVTVVCQAIGVSTRKLCALSEGDSITDLAGPLGHVVNTNGIGKVICIGGGVGTAEIYPIAKEMKNSGNDLEVIIGARTEELVICEKEIRGFCDDVHVTTDDGSCGRKGFVTDILSELIEKEKIDLVFAVGPVPMMKKVSDITRDKKIKTLVSLNTIMIDGTGMCGGCRLNYNGKPSFACVDGPEFDGHLVDFDDLMTRGARYKEKEKKADERYEKKCRIGLDK